MIDLIGRLPPSPRSTKQPNQYYYDTVHLTPSGADLVVMVVAEDLAAQRVYDLSGG